MLQSINTTKICSFHLPLTSSQSQSKKISQLSIIKVDQLICFYRMIEQGGVESIVESRQCGFRCSRRRSCRGCRSRRGRCVLLSILLSLAKSIVLVPLALLNHFQHHVHLLAVRDTVPLHCCYSLHVSRIIIQTMFRVNVHIRMVPAYKSPN